MLRVFLLAVAAGSLAPGCDSLKARMLAQEAVSRYHRGELPKAAAIFDQASRLDPAVAAIQLDLGFASLAVYQSDPRGVAGQAAAGKAVLAFERYLELRPSEERARVFLLQTFVDTGRYQEAVAFFRPLVDRVPPDGEALGTLGLIAAKTGRYPEAKGWYERRIAVEPQNADARLAYGVLLWDHLHAHPELPPVERLALCDLALRELGASIQIRPKAPNGYLYTNLVYRERAAGEPDDDHKRIDLEEANRFFRLAAGLQKAN